MISVEAALVACLVVDAVGVSWARPDAIEAALIARLVVVDVGVS